MAEACETLAFAEFLSSAQLDAIHIVQAPAGGPTLLDEFGVLLNSDQFKLQGVTVDVARSVETETGTLDLGLSSLCPLLHSESFMKNDKIPSAVAKALEPVCRPCGGDDKPMDRGEVVNYMDVIYHLHAVAATAAHLCEHFIGSSGGMLPTAVTNHSMSASLKGSLDFLGTSIASLASLISVQKRNGPDTTMTPALPSELILRWADSTKQLGARVTSASFSAVADDI